MSDPTREEIENKVYEMKRRFPYQFEGELFAYEFPDGWGNLFGILCCSVDQMLNNHNLKTDAEKASAFGGWAQVKSKFAGARIYFHSINREAYPDVADAYSELNEQIERFSHFVCEGCGRPGEWRSIDGWEVTVCDKHFKEWSEERSRY